jgi:AcrR family transcriptional regulator
MVRAAAATAQGEASREKILSTAIALFSERGYAGTSMTELCERAGVVKTAVYWHFESKEGLLEAALERVAAEWITEIRASVEQAGGIDARLDRFVAGLRWLVVERGEALALILGMILERAEIDADRRESLRRIVAQARTAIAEGIRDALGRDLPGLEEVADVALGLLNGLVLSHRLERDPARLERQLAQFRQTFALSVLAAAQRGDTP